MVKEYICKQESATEAIKEIDTFVESLNKFNEKYDNKYDYDIKLTETDDEIDKWLIELKMTRNER